MAAVNNIPTVSDFKKSVGRYYFVQRLRHGKDRALQAIFRALRDVESLRQANTPVAITKLRTLRKACAAWLYPPSLYERPEDQPTKTLGHNVSRRIEAIITAQLASSSGRANYLARQRSGMAQDRRMILKDGNVQIGKSVDPQYHLERFTKTHVAGVYNEKYQRYLRDFPHSTMSLEEYVTLVVDPLKADDPHFVLGRAVRSHSNVVYCNDVQRQTYKLRLSGDGLLRWADGRLLDTSGMLSIQSGQGWAIFVVDMAQDFYVNAHQRDRFHHSSFLAGAPVLSAGELCVSKGVLVGITNKTGHYKAGAAELHRALLLLQKFDRSKGWTGGIGAGMEKVAVIDATLDADVWYNAEAVIAARGDFNDATLRATKPMQRPSATNMAALAEAVKPLLIF